MNYRAFALVTALMLCLLPMLRRAAQGDEKSLAAVAEQTLAVTPPYAYLLPADSTKIVETLQRRGIDVEELREDVELDVETYQIAKMEIATTLPGRFGQHSPVYLEVKARQRTKRIHARTFVVRTQQKLGSLAASLLEPQSEANVVTCNYVDSMKEGQDYAVVRLGTKTPLMLAKARALPEHRGQKFELTVEMLDNGQLPNFNGEPVSIRWLEDGDHFLQIKDGQLWKVHAVSGGSDLYVPTSKFSPSTSEVMQELTAASLEWGRQNPLHGPLAREVVSFPVRAQDSKEKGKGVGARELAAADPTKTFNAFVRNGNLYVEDIATKTERALTKDGSDVILNGKSDWVYFEEVYNRAGYKHFWWSNDGAYIAFLRSDLSPEPKATVVDYSKPKQFLEVTYYPRAGDPNALVKLGIVRVKDGEVGWVDLSDYAKDDSFLITRVGFLPDNKNVYYCVQDRSQTWLDFCIVGVEAGKSKKIVRDTTKAWVEVPSRNFLKDNSVLLSSERSGWKHLYHYSKDGKLLNQLTKGDWDVRATVKKVDEDEGTVTFTGSKDNPNGGNTFKVKLDGSGQVEQLTMGKGDSQVLFSPKGHLFVNTASEPEMPPQVTLHRADGKLIRVLDTNPVYVQDQVKAGEYKRFQIATPDGFMLEASYQLPAKFDPEKRYPVWFTTYGGPRAPTLGGGGKGGDQALANQGYIVFRCDPRSASNKGAISAWACYKQLGVSELKDIETAIKWLTAKPWVDADRVGFTGTSYGGFLVAYCMANSKLFAAGVAGAPVTDWRNYDSIYTERYMMTPAENEEGYNVTSAVKTAKNLHGRLLLAHGLKDDNVHVQNSFQMAHALQLANKEFDIMTYPLARHGGFGPSFGVLQREFMKKYLKPMP